MGKQTEKIKKYIEEDRPTKLKSYLTKHGLEMAKVKMSKGQTALHYSVKKISHGVLMLLLKSGVNINSRNDKGQTAVEMAVRKATKAKKSSALKIYEEIIIPLVDHQFDSYKQPSKLQQKLKQLQNRLFHTAQDPVSPEKCYPHKSDVEISSDDDDDDVDDDEEEERKWTDKLAAEFDDDFMGSHGRYEEDYTEECEKETYDQWASRLNKEYHKKTSANRKHPYSSASKLSNQNKDTKNSKQKQKEDELREKRKELEKIYAEKQKKIKEISKMETKYKYEEEFSVFFKTKSERLIKYDDVPWPFKSKISDMIDCLFCDLPNKDCEAYRKYLRDQKIRWHPDKFQQNFGEFLDANHRDKILDKVTEISQCLNQLSDRPKG